ncbi:enoyl-CoA hydratase/isomerase family protein [uncultured Pigmentiphaga sp.]|uniref:enoyl-CoA hydratase/isomerase family protein n=1 Tax=uncultured Pigmentiphaga sp. TaxID=340361 RepID=UPI002635EC41|nr:enoyl-CoA hydratase/isomerase family protein [uncultured Pigmentiphaga sp.]
MIEHIPLNERQPRMEAAGLPREAVTIFLQSVRAWEARTAPESLDADLVPVQTICRQGRELLAHLPRKSERDATQKDAGHVIFHLLADASWRFFRHHAQPVYRELTNNGTRSLRVDELAWRAAERLPGILPTEDELRAESELLQKDKDGLEINQGLFFSHLFRDRAIGSHLIRAMLRPLPQSFEYLDEFRKTGRVQLDKALVEAKEQAGYLTFQNLRYLNAEDDTTMVPFEIATDLILLHPELRMGVMRGGVVDHPKYAGRRVFSAGINLTHIYHGKKSYLGFLTKNLGFFNKVHRGILPPGPDSLDVPLDEPETTVEKPWVAVVETFAIGGGCQLLLVADYVIAETGSFFSLPARKEGIIPGLANLRLPRFTGESLARQAIMFDKLFKVETPEGRTIVSEVVAPEEIEAAVTRCASNALGAGMVSISANRKALRAQTESMEALRQYMVIYAREQAFCHLSDDLIRNLEKNWNAQQRKL